MYQSRAAELSTRIKSANSASSSIRHTLRSELEKFEKTGACYAGCWHRNLYKQRSEPDGKLGQLPLSISSTGLALLFMLHDEAANFPITGDHYTIVALTYLTAGLVNGMGNLLD